MGVRGLFTFLSSCGSSLLAPHKFCNTTAIIDGNNFFWIFAFPDCTESAKYVFGGDYDYFYSRVTNFFGFMLKCGITPILLFDGCQAESNFKTLITRRREKLESLRNLRRLSQCKGDQRKGGNLSPVLLFQAFLEGLDEMGITYVQLYENADREIAALAEHFKCPVVSSDSDFFIHDVDWIPLHEMDFTGTEDNDGSLYFRCRLYRSGSISKLFPGLERPMLPMVSIILGNDVVGRDFIQVFTKSGTRNFPEIFKSLQTSVNRESVITKILQSLNGKDVEVVERAIREVLGKYDVSSPVSLSVMGVETETTRDATRSIYGLDLSELPVKLLKFYEGCKLSTLILGLLRFRRHYLGINIEDINEESCHFSSIPIIQGIYKILRTLMDLPEDVILNVRHGGVLVDRRLTCSSQDYTGAVPLSGNVFAEDEDFRRKVFFQSLGLDEIEGERLREFDDDWILFITSVVYWSRNTQKWRRSHLSAVLLTALAVYVESIRDRGGDGHRVRGSPARSESFTHLVKRIPDSERMKLRDLFEQGRKPEDDVLARDDFFPAIHVFSCLQSVLMHVIQLNYLLGEVLRGFLVHRFYSGTFLLNLFVLEEEKHFTKMVVEDLPGMRGAYETLEEFVEPFCTGLSGQITSGNFPPFLSGRSVAGRKRAYRQC